MCHIHEHAGPLQEQSLLHVQEILDMSVCYTVVEGASRNVSVQHSHPRAVPAETATQNHHQAHLHQYLLPQNVPGYQSRNPLETGSDGQALWHALPTRKECQCRTQRVIKLINGLVIQTQAYFVQ